MNRQVPEQIAIVGNGKVARHMMHYFASVGQPYTHWFRQTKSSPVSGDHSNAKPSRLASYKQQLRHLFQLNSSVDTQLGSAPIVLLLIPDDQIQQFIASNPSIKNKKLVHFSGSLNIEGAVGCHPLMTFGPDLYDENEYTKIPFVVDEGVDFKSLFPLFTNPVHHIKLEDKARYHAYCVMAGNFSQMMWQAIGREMQRINLPTDVMSAYLLQNTKNFIQNPELSATGPFVRGDLKTIAKHQVALAAHPFAEVYQAFFNLNREYESTVKRSVS